MVNKIKQQQVKTDFKPITFDTQQSFNQSYINDLTQILKTNTSIPTHTPKKFIDFFYLYKNETDYRFYTYINNEWKYTDISGVNSAEEYLVGTGSSDNKTYFNTQLGFYDTNTWTSSAFSNSNWQGTSFYGFATAASYIITTDRLYTGLKFNNDIIIEHLAEFDMGGTNVRDAGFGLSENYTTTYNSTTYEAVKFGVDDETLYAITCDGSSVTTNEIAGIDVGNKHLYRIEFTTGTDAKFYVDGVLKSTITTTLPDSESVKFFVAMSNPSSDYDMTISSINISIKI